MCSENKGADQLRGNREADLCLCFRICKKPVFSQRDSYISEVPSDCWLDMFVHFHSRLVRYLCVKLCLNAGYWFGWTVFFHFQILMALRSTRSWR